MTSGKLVNITEVIAIAKLVASRGGDLGAVIAWLEDGASLLEVEVALADLPLRPPAPPRPDLLPGVLPAGEIERRVKLVENTRTVHGAPRRGMIRET